MTAVDWSQFRKCPVCFAALGRPCVSVLGPTTRVQAARPHGGRQFTAAAKRDARFGPVIGGGRG